MVPKKNNLVLFASKPPFADNSRALFEYVKQRLPQYECVWLVNEAHAAKMIRSRYHVQAYEFKSLMGIFSVIRASTIFMTHPEPSWLFYIAEGNLRQKLVLLWHGMPLKAMGFCDKTESPANLRFIKAMSQKVNLIIATSNLTKSALCACFFVDPRKIIVTGQPRNDYLFDIELQRRRLQDLIGVPLSRYRAIIMWLPTFRTGHQDRREGRSLLFALSNEEVNELSRYLVEKNYLLIIKPHILEEDSLPGLRDNVFLLTDELLQRNGVDLYHILGAADLLITDYSSVYIDFLLVNKPIIFDVNDYEYYGRVRGFMLTPLDFWLPGPKVKSFNELVKEIDSLIENPSLYDRERQLINQLLNHHRDNRSCERVWSTVMASSE